MHARNLQIEIRNGKIIKIWYQIWNVFDLQFKLCYCQYPVINNGHILEHILVISSYPRHIEDIEDIEDIVISSYPHHILEHPLLILSRLRFVSAGPTRTLSLWPWRVFQIVIIIIIIITESSVFKIELEISRISPTLHSPDGADSSLNKLLLLQHSLLWCIEYWLHWLLQPFCCYQLRRLALCAFIYTLYTLTLYTLLKFAFIPEQFTVKAHQALFEGEGEGEEGEGQKSEEQHFYSSLHSHSHSKSHKTNKIAHILNSTYRAHDKNTYQSRKKYKS